MSSRKTYLNHHIAYLESRRSGVEAAIGKTDDEARELVSTLNKSISEHNAELSVILKEEQDAREAKKEADKEANRRRHQ